MSSLKDVIVRYWYGSSGDNEFQKVYGGGKLRGQDKGRGVDCFYLSIFTLMAMIDKMSTDEFLFFHARVIELGKIDATMSDTPTTNTRR